MITIKAYFAVIDVKFALFVQRERFKLNGELISLCGNELHQIRSPTIHTGVRSVGIVECSWGFNLNIYTLRIFFIRLQCVDIPVHLRQGKRTRG